jgi:hypothetical protein
MTSTSIYIENLHKSCVYLVTYSGSLLPPKFKDSTITPTKYIGSGFVNKIFNGYRGSVGSAKYARIWKQELKENPHLFHLEFISFHDNRQDALMEENLVQRDLNVIKSENYVNLSYANGDFICNGHTEESKKRMQIAAKNRPLPTEETRKKLQLSRKFTRHTEVNGIIYLTAREAQRASGLSTYKFYKLKKGSEIEKHTRTKRIRTKEHNKNIGLKHRKETIFNGVIYPSVNDAVLASGLSRYKFFKLEEYNKISFNSKLDIVKT